jgi:enamine deaminase RidA (YjgF/YER057c/UK114 family)
MLTSTCSLIFTTSIFLIACQVARAADVQHVQVTHEGVAMRAAVAPAGATLAHTAQVFCTGEDGQVVAGGSAEQLARALSNLEAILKPAGASLDTAVRVSLYAATPEAATEGRRILDARLKCPITAVVSGLPQKGAVVALDAVAVAAAAANPPPTLDAAKVRLLPGTGQTAYISGMAAKGANLAEATRATLGELDGMIRHLKADRKDVVHVKSFFRGVDGVPDARAELAKFFDGRPPPETWVEWTMNAPVEIEMIVALSAAAENEKPAADTVSYHNPPPSKVSPVYSRLAIVHGGRMIYTSGPYAPEKVSDPEAETRLLLTALREVIRKAGGDFDHLVKATYYPATDATSTALNRIRPEFYDPKRPPAASKAPIRHTGAEGRALTLDLIAVTPR